MSLYGLDALLLAWATDWLSVAFNGLALFFLFNGFRASRQLAAARATVQIPSGMAPPLTPQSRFGRVRRRNILFGPGIWRPS